MPEAQKPCIYCGAPGEVHHAGASFVAQCTGTHMPAYACYGDTPAEALASWNRISRAALGEDR